MNEQFSLRKNGLTVVIFALILIVTVVFGLNFKGKMEAAQDEYEQIRESPDPAIIR